MFIYIQQCYFMYTEQLILTKIINIKVKSIIVSVVYVSTSGRARARCTLWGWAEADARAQSSADARTGGRRVRDMRDGSGPAREWKRGRLMADTGPAEATTRLQAER